MKILITENQNVLARRYFKIKNEVYNRMDGSDPCYYSAYHNLDKYQRDLLKAAIDDVTEEEGLEFDSREWADIRNELLHELYDDMKDFYYKFIMEKCPRW